MGEKYEAITVREDDKLPGDRRRYPRASCQYTAEFVDPGSGRTIKGTVLDISQVGMRIKTLGATRLADPDHLRFYVFINGSMLKLSGAVVRQSADGYMGIEFRKQGESLQERVTQHVSDAASRNTKIEFRKRVYQDAAPPEAPTMRTVAQSYMRSGHTIHEGMAAARATQQSGSRKWLDRRIATHMSDQ